MNEVAGLLLHTDAFDLTEDESEMIAERITDVSELYDSVPMIDPRTAAWGKLAIAMVKIYTPRVVVYRNQVVAKKGPRKVQPPVHFVNQQTQVI